LTDVLYLCIVVQYHTFTMCEKNGKITHIVQPYTSYNSELNNNVLMALSD